VGLILLIIKLVLLILIIVASSMMGILFSQKYINRVKQLKNFKIALNILKTKMQYTYAPLPDIFLDISKSITGQVGVLFLEACKQMKTKNATQSFNEAVDTTNMDVTKQDKEAMKNLGKMLGATDIVGQINEIELTENFINKQIELAEEEKQKNAKLYKTLGVLGGIAIVIILL